MNTDIVEEQVELVGANVLPLLLKSQGIKSAVILPYDGHFRFKFTLQSGTIAYYGTKKKQVREFKTTDAIYSIMTAVGMTCGWTPSVELSNSSVLV